MENTAPESFELPSLELEPLEMLEPEDLGTPERYALAAEVRAVEEGHNARVLPDGSVLVKSDSHPGSYVVRVGRVVGGQISLRCTCPSGAYRTSLPIPCKHAALVARRLEREGLAYYDDGVWRMRARTALRAALAATVPDGREHARATSRPAVPFPPFDRAA
jgi:hypothetical protein